MSNLQTTAAIYEAFGRGDIPTIIELLDEDIAWEPGGVDHDIPWLKPGRGRAHALRFFETLGAMDFNAFEVVNILDGGTTVVGLIKVDITMKATGARFTDEEAHVWTFNARGKVASFRHLCDTIVHKRAAGV